jgi:hypothetical protein
VYSSTVIKFLAKRKVKPDEILHRLSAQPEERMTLSCTSVYNWCNKLSEVHEVAKKPHAHIQPTAITDANFHHMEELILENRQITECTTASKILLSLSNSEEKALETVTEDCTT